jgi:hypothetical protein
LVSQRHLAGRLMATPGTKQNEITRLQGEITSEISRDAPAIAKGIFGDNKNHPDMAQVSNQQIDDLYRQKYQTNDRAWLQAEARRDPQQFLAVAKRIGVQAPPTGPGSSPPPSPGAGMQQFAANAQAALAAPPQAAPMAGPGLPPAPGIPAALPAPPLAPAGAVVPGLAPPPPAPVILGPNGQPLPPTGM